MVNSEMKNGKPLLQVKGLKTYFPVKKGVFSKIIGHVRAVDDVNLRLYPGKTLGLVGESGCGKTTLGRTLLQLNKPTAGEIYFDDSAVAENSETSANSTKLLNLAGLSNRKMKPYRRQMQMIFQDPYSSLNPRMTIGSIIAEALTIHKLAKGKQKWKRVAEILESVGLEPDYLRRFPHEFSGGQRQRIGIARAIAVEPKTIIADEPVSALDVSIQAQIINLLLELQEKMRISYLFISHDLSLVGYISHEVAVMYLGKIVEFGTKKNVFSKPLHPYTKALMEAVPVPDPGKSSKKIILEGDVPSPINPPSGCYFHPRCKHCMDKCKKEIPPVIEVEDGHQVMCFLYDK